MADVIDRLAGLSPERRRLLEMRLRMQQERAAGPELRPRARPDGTAPLSHAQARLWLLDRMDPGAAAYNMPHPLRIAGALDAEALARALDALRARHEALRTTLEERAGGPVQVIHPPDARDLPVTDLSVLSADEREAEVRRRIDADANTGFDLVRGPLVRAELLRLQDDEHVLLLCMHHVVSDGWSMGVFARELGTLYAALGEGREPHLPPLAVQYADFAAWQRETLSGEALERLTAFWRAALAGAPPALALPTDRVRPPAESHRGRTLKTRIAPELAGRLRELARAEGATLFNVLSAAVRAVLARHAGEDDVVLGTPVANRQHSGLEGLVGFFVNTLPLRAKVSPREGFRAAVAREKVVALAAFDHQELPFDRIVEELKLPRDPARNPVFQAMVTLQNARMEPVALGGVEIAPLAPEYHTAKFDLTLDHYEEDDGGVRMEAEYATDLFDARTVARIVAHVHALLAEAADAPDRPLAALAGAGPAERAFVLRAVNHTEAEYERDATVHALFAAQAARTPDAAAVETGGAVLTYAALDARASAVAHRLREAGIGAGSRVGVAMERSAGLVVAMLGILRAGAAYVPLDPAYPAERLAFMVADAGLGALVVDDGVPGGLAGFGGPVVALSKLSGDGDDTASTEPDARDAFAESLAYVVYTSGSTGTPKGVAVPHRAVVRLVRNTAYLPFAADERIAQLSNASFDALTFEVWGALLNGGCVVLLERDTALQPAALAAALRERGITTAFLTTALFNQVAREAPDGFAPLRHLLVGGEAHDPAAMRAVLEAGGPGRLLNVYGPTESTTFATWQEVRSVPEGAASIPIGLPLANTTAYVLDASLRPCGLGETGELLLGGDGLARGYLGRPGMTAERFVPDSVSGSAGARLYRTGDRVRRLEDGAIEYLGRLDQQVKLRGFRIEPGEVEAALRALPSVADAAVLVRTEGGEKRLVAYVVSADGETPSAAGLRDALAGRLPEYMVPTAFVALDAIPLTPNGKVDRAALPAPGAGADDDFAGPRTPTETALAAIYGEVLELERVSVEDDFFLLGGHSLLAAQVISRIRRAFGAEVPLRAVFEAPSVRRLAARLDALRGTGEAPLPPVVTVDRSGPLPLSFEQERMWFLERLEPGAGVYNMPARIRLRGRVDAEALRRALELVVHRHEALRTLVHEDGDAPMQRVTEPSRFELPVVAPADADEARRVLDAEAWRPIDLAAEPAVRALLVRLSDDEQVLALTIHHAQADGWSLGIVLREASAAYEAFVAGGEPQLPPVDLQYGDFAAWQRAHLSGERLRGEAEWWRAKLAGAPPLLELPTDRPHPPRQSYRGGAIAFHLPASLVRRVKALASAEGATAFMALLAGFQALLARLSGQDDVVVGTPVAGRVRAETESIVGLFVNTLALRADLSGDPSFGALLAQVREGTLGAFAHQELPFEKLVELLKVERSLSHAPVFQVLFALNSQDTGTLRLPGVASAWGELELRAAKFDLSLTLEEAADGGMEGTAEYAADLFDRDTVVRLVERYQRLLEAAATDPARRLSRVELRSVEERAEERARGDGEERDWPFVPLHNAVEAQAACTPNAVAVEAADATLTYAALNARADAVAAALRKRGVGRGALVAVVLPRGLDLPAALLGVLKAGAAYVPIDPTYPEERVRWMLDDADAALAITTAALAAPLRAAGLSALALEVLDLGAQAAAPPVPSAGVEGDELAYVIYTSGSTGRPKGAAIPHRALANHMRWMGEAFPLAADDRVLQKTPVSFDASVWEFWAPLLAGATLVMAGPESHRDPAVLARETAERGITTLQLVPTLLRALLDEPRFAEARALRRLFAGGEALPAGLARHAREILPDVRVINLYGPAEACIDATAQVVEDGDADGVVVPLGDPIANLRAYVLDARLEPVPALTAGELWLAGEGLGRGYHARPDLTAERWLPEPFSGRAGARMYRTGDRVRRRPDGALEYLGRADAQVKVRGVRVELGEVEAALAALPGVREAAAALRDGDLVAYLVGDAPSAAELRGRLRAHYPDAVVPTRFVTLDALPRTPGGKLDRRALPDPDAAPDAAGEAPRTPTETVLAGIWSEVLEIDRVGRHDSFFALGGHSLLATRVATRIRRALQVELPLRELFDAPTLESLAARVDAARAAAGGVPEAAIPRLPRDRPLPLSFAQERLWFVQRLAPHGTAFNMPMVLRLRGALAVETLRRALGEIVRRHESLRTVFARGDEGPVQSILPWTEVDLPLTDLAGDADASAELRRMLDERAKVPFDLEHGRLLRLHLVRLAGDDHRLLVEMHHVVSDGWSMERFHAELAALYAAFAAGEPSPLPELAVQYADFAAWQRDWLRGERLAAQLAYWQEKLAGAPPVQLPTDRPRPPLPALEGDAVEFTLPPALADGVEALGREEGATPFMAFLAAFYAVVHRWTAQDDVVLGTAVAGRGRPELEELIGFFVNPLALRVDLSGAPSFRELLRRVRATTLEAYAHQDLPFEKLLEALKVERSLSMHPLTQVAFTLHHEAPLPHPPGLRIEAHDEGGDSGSAKVDLTLGIARSKEGARCSLEYATALFDRATIGLVAERFAALLAAAVADPDAPAWELVGAMTPAERDRVLHEWSGTAHEWPRRPIHRLVSAQAARTPGAVALRQDGRDTTYGEMEAAASRLARHLAAHGVGPEQRVGVMADRSTGMIVAVLGVLKAGAAYVPLDPAYPAKRLRWMLEDSGVHTVVSATAASAAALPAEGIDVVALDRDAAEIASLSSEDPGVEVGDDHLAYVIYTSGSTGKPKGVLVPHRGVPNLVSAQVRRFEMGTESRVLQFASLAFDASVSEVFTALVAGGTLVLAGRDEILPGRPLVELLQRERITVVTFPPSVLAAIADAELPDLRVVISAGEAVGDAVVARWAPGRVFVNAYGPTENTVGVSSARCEPDGRKPSIGRPFENVRAYVLDARMEPVPPGLPGELYAGGPGVARGYHGRPALTAAAFVPDPFSAEPGARLYRTGDRARWRADGTLDFLGRVDAQVKVRGYRVEPGEIAALLAADEDVRDAVVGARGETGAERLVAWVVPAEGAVLDAGRLRDGLRAHLPDYLVPSAIVRVDELPLTPNGKVDLARLPDPAPDAGDEQAPPRSELERTVAAAWCGVLGVERVGMNANFFEIGGHSLLLARLQEALETALGRRVELVDVFRFPTVRSFAAQLGGGAAEAGDAAAQPHTGAAQRGDDRGAARRAAFARRR